MKKQQLHTKNKPSKRFSATLFIFLMFGMVLFMASFTSALEFDNVKRYNNTTKTVEVKNAFGLGDVIAEVTLKTPQNFLVGAGYGKVAEFDVKSFDNYTEVFKELEFYDLNKDNEKFVRTFDYKTKSFKDVIVDDYGNVAVGKSGNGTNLYEWQIIGNHTETKEIWTNFTLNNFERNENLTIGIFTTVEVNDKIEWIPNFMGIRVDEWAGWTAALEVGLRAYYKLDNPTGDAIDQMYGFNGTVTGTIRGIPGVIGNQTCFDGGDNINFGNLYPSSVNAHTLNFWINTTDTTAESVWFSQDGAGQVNDVDTGFGPNVDNWGGDQCASNDWCMELDGTDTNVFAHSVVTDGALHMFTIIVDGTTHMIFLDGASIDNVTSAKNIWGAAGAQPLYMGTGLDSGVSCIDEVSFSDRAFTVAEVGELYNGGAGRTINTSGGGGSTAPILTLIAPSDGYSQGNLSDIVFNLTATDDVAIQNVTLFFNGSILSTNTSGFNGTYTFTTSVVDGNYSWYAYIYDDSSNVVNATTRYFTVDTVSPIVTITSPTGLSNYSRVGNTLNVNWTVIETNPSTCWFDYNGTNYTRGCTTNTSIVLESDRFNVTVWINDTAGNLGRAYKSWSYKVFENSLTYNTSSFETKAEKFTLNVSANSSLTAVTLNYGGVDKTTTLASNVSTVTFDVPLGVTNNTFYYKFTYGTESFNSDNRNVSVNESTIALCNATHNIKFINFTFANENNESLLNASIPTANLTYYIGSGSVRKSLIYSQAVERSSYAFCALTAANTYNLDTRIQYEATGHPQRVYEPALFTVTNATKNVTLYLLPTADGIYVTFQVINVAEQVISNVFMNATRLIGSVQGIVGEGFTDSSGGLTMWLNPDFSHNFMFAKTGYTTLATSFAPTQTSYTITLGNSSTSSAKDYTRGIKFSVRPEFNSPLYDFQNYTFNFSLNSTYWTVQEFGFNLINSTQTLVSQSLSANGGTVSFPYNVSGQDRLEMQYWWKIDNNYMNASTFYVVLSGEGTQWSINNTVTDFRSYLADGMFGLDNFAMALIIFIILMFSVGIMSFKYGLTSPTAVSILIFSIVLFLDVGLNLVAFLNPWGVDHFITIFTALIMIALLFRGTQ